MNKLLADYASGYEVEYGQRESVNDLIPHMLEAFIKTDRGFQKKNKMPVPVAQQTFKYPALMTGNDPDWLNILLQSNGSCADKATFDVNRADVRFAQI